MRLRFITIHNNHNRNVSNLVRMIIINNLSFYFLKIKLRKKNAKTLKMEADRELKM